MVSKDFGFIILMYASSFESDCNYMDQKSKVEWNQQKNVEETEAAKFTFCQNLLAHLFPMQILVAVKTIETLQVLSEFPDFSKKFAFSMPSSTDNNVEKQTNWWNWTH